MHANREWMVLLACCAAFFGRELWSADVPPQPITRIAVGSCLNEQQQAPIWEAVVAAKPELFLYIGDNIYADTQDMEIMKAKYAKLGASAGYKKLRATCSVLATWDDHDYGEDDAGAEYPKKRASQEIFLNFFNEPKDSPRREQEGVYDAKVFGPADKRVQVILLDTRYHRSALKQKAVRQGLWDGPYEPTDAETQAVLGETQWAWLAEQLKQPAQLRILCSSIQVVADEHGWEKWGNLPKEKARLLTLLKDSKVGGVIIVSGDRHFAELSKLEPQGSGLAYPLYDLTASSLNRKLTMPEARPSRFRVCGPVLVCNFGMLLIDWGKDDPELTFEIRDTAGELKFKEAVKLGTLR